MTIEQHTITLDGGQRLKLRVEVWQDRAWWHAAACWHDDMYGVGLAKGSSSSSAPEAVGRCLDDARRLFRAAKEGR